MAWTLQQNNLTGEPEYVFNGFENGIGDSPYSGISFMSGLDIKNSPKTAYSNPARRTSTMNFSLAQPAEQINYIIQEPKWAKNLYSITAAGTLRQSLDDGKTWTIITGNSTTSAHGNGMFIYKGWLHLTTDVGIDAILLDTAGGTGTTGSWSNQFITFAIPQAIGVNHYAIVGRDQIAYMCNGNYISSLAEKVGQSYSPATGSSTYNWTEQALGLPFADTNNLGAQATYLCELRTSLLVAYGNFIIPWDRTSTSYDIPFPFPETIAKMINVNNTIYCFAGVPVYFNTYDYNGVFSGTGQPYNPVCAGRGNIYYYNGFSGDLLKTIPDHLAVTYPAKQEPRWLIGGIAAFNGKILFGAMDYNAQLLGQAGVYSLDVSTQSQAIQYQVAPSPLTIKNSGGIFPYGFPTAICVTNNITVNSNILSFATGVTIVQGDATSGYGYQYTDDLGFREQGIIQTDVLQVGTHLQNKTFNTIEVRFRNPLSAGETVQVYSYKYFGGSTSTSDQTNFTYTAPTASKELSFTCPTVVQNNEEIELYLITNPIQNGSGIPIKEIILR
jgi:hypothetical protein